MAQRALRRSLGHTTDRCGEAFDKRSALGCHEGVEMEPWERLAAAQAGLLARRQLRELGVDRFRVRNQLMARRWVALSPRVIGTTTGRLDRRQTMWLGVLHAGPSALVGGLSAAEVHGLRNWHRAVVTVMVPDRLPCDALPGIAFVRTRRDLRSMRARRPGLPVSRVEPAVLLFAAHQQSRRTAQGVLAAVVQQRLTTPRALRDQLAAMAPLRWAALLNRALDDIEGGSQSLAEMDVRRMCRAGGLAPPQRQRPRHDSSGRWRWTDCEWRLASGHVIILEVDGGFHMESEQWEDDLARQRRISHPGRTVVRCTARELRDQPHEVARDLRALGVPGRVA